MATQVAQEHSGFSAAGVPSAGHNARQVLTTHFYHRLPHPLIDLLKELKVVVGTDVNPLTSCNRYLKYTS